MVMRLIHKLEDWDAEFKDHYYTIAGIIEEEDGDARSILNQSRPKPQKTDWKIDQHFWQKR